MERSCKGGSSQENDSANSAQYTRAARELSQGMFLNCHIDSKGPRERATSSIQTEVDFRSSAEKQRRFASFNLDQSTLDSTPRPGVHTTRNPSDNQPRHAGSDEHASLQMSSGKKYPGQLCISPSQATDPYQFNRYLYFGYYPQDQSISFSPAFPPSEPSSYSQADVARTNVPECDSTSNEVLGTGSAIVAPYPIGVYYSMPVYQRSVCFPDPSTVPMVSYTFPSPSIQGTMATPMGHDPEHQAYPATDAVSPVPLGFDSRSSSDPMYLNTSSSMYPALPSPSASNAYGRYVYHDPRHFYNFSSGATMHPPHLIQPPVPVTSGYAVPSYERAPYSDKSYGFNSARRRRSTQPQVSNRPAPSSNTQKQKQRVKEVSTEPVTPSVSNESVLIPPPSVPTSSQLTDTVACASEKQERNAPAARNILGASSDNQVNGTRSIFVMWCGNVPSDATLEELWEFFSSIPENFSASVVSSGTAADEPNEATGPACVYETDNPAGILSIFIISRSSCAFVNYASREHLEKACAYFHGRPLRTKSSCPRMVCRPRKLEDAEYAGVAAQRGKGVHTNWFRHQRKLEKEHFLELGQSECALEDAEERSFSSTNSSLLAHPYFSNRYFILKSRSEDALVTALRTNVWCTQPHNEPVLDQAFRNSEQVILFFSENFSGQFFGYAVMTSRPGRALPTTESLSQSDLSSDKVSQSLEVSGGPEPGHNEPHPISSAHVAHEAKDSVPENNRSSSFASDVSLTPSMDADNQVQEDLAVRAKLHNLRLDTDATTSDLDSQSLRHRTQANGPSDASTPLRSGSADESSPLSPIHASRSLHVGQPFYIEWKTTNPLPFSEIHNLRNPWRDNRLIKVSRDGTELEPNVGKQLISVWQAYLQKETQRG